MHLFNNVVCVKAGDKYSHDTVLTFDQPLYWKAMEIKTHEQVTKSRLKDIVLLLGTFHTCMSFYGSIGHLLAGSGDGILKNMFVKHIFDYSYKRKDMAVTITEKHSLNMMVRTSRSTINCSSNDC